jgi:hypothetical protein
MMGRTETRRRMELQLQLTLAFFFVFIGIGEGQVLMEGSCPPIPLMKGFSADKVSLKESN